MAARHRTLRWSGLACLVLGLTGLCLPTVDVVAARLDTADSGALRVASAPVGGSTTTTLPGSTTTSVPGSTTTTTAPGPTTTTTTSSTSTTTTTEVPSTTSTSTSTSTSTTTAPPTTSTTSSTTTTGVVATTTSTTDPGDELGDGLDRPVEGPGGGDGGDVDPPAPDASAAPLPQTGSAGTVGLVLAASCLTGIGVVLLVAARRRRRSEELARGVTPVATGR